MSDSDDARALHDLNRRVTAAIHGARVMGHRVHQGLVIYHGGGIAYGGGLALAEIMCENCPETVVVTDSGTEMWEQRCPHPDAHRAAQLERPSQIGLQVEARAGVANDAADAP